MSKRVHKALSFTLDPRSCHSSPDLLPLLLVLTRSIDVGHVPSLEQLGFAKESLQRSRPESWQDGGAQGPGLRGGEWEALQHLQAFISDVKEAHARLTRGPGLQGTSASPLFSCKISPWLALGCVSPRTVSVECESALVFFGWSITQE